MTEQPKPFMWVLRAFRSRGPNIVGYDSAGRCRGFLKTHRMSSDEKAITLYDDGTWKKGIHDD